MRHIVSVSSGLGSAFTWKLICDRIGSENVTGLFADVNGEHPDNYRFLAEVQYELGSKLIKLANDGRTIWDVMIEQRFLANTRIDTCSKFLKREPVYAWLRENCDPADTMVYLGIDWTESHRLDKAAPGGRRLDGRWLPPCASDPTITRPTGRHGSTRPGSGALRCTRWASAMPTAAVAA